MPFVVHTEKLNLIPSVVAEVNDEIHTAKRQQQQQQQLRSAFATTATVTVTTKKRGLSNKYTPQTNDDHQIIDENDHEENCSNTNTTEINHIGSSSNNNNSNVNPHPDVTSLESRWYEMNALFQLTLPTMIIQLGQVIPGFAIASYIGRTYSNDISYLDGYTLASLSVNLFTLSLLLGLYTASDTLSPQAYGAGNMKEVGYLAIRGFLASMMVVLPIIVLLMYYMKPMLLWIGEDRMSVTHACAWFNIYAYSIPFYALYQVTLKFLSAQNQMQPLVICCLISTCLVLPISLYTFGTTYGYIGTAIAMSVYQSFQAILLLLYIYIRQPHDPSTWSGLWDGIQNAMQWKPLIDYMVRCCHHSLFLFLLRFSKNVVYIF
jgi:Na+-driven multidrug efflux pump